AEPQARLQTMIMLNILKTVKSYGIGDGIVGSLHPFIIKIYFAGPQVMKTGVTHTILSRKLWIRLPFVANVKGILQGIALVHFGYGEVRGPFEADLGRA